MRKVLTHSGSRYYAYLGSKGEKKMVISLLVAFAGLTVGNYSYQAFTGRDWSKAFERTFFQAIALVTFYVISLL